MGGVISFFIFFLLGILDTVFAVKLNLSPWKFLLAGNPRLPARGCMIWNAFSGRRACSVPFMPVSST